MHNDQPVSNGLVWRETIAMLSAKPFRIHLWSSLRHHDIRFTHAIPANIQIGNIIASRYFTLQVCSE